MDDTNRGGGSAFVGDAGFPAWAATVAEGVEQGIEVGLLGVVRPPGVAGVAGQVNQVDVSAGRHAGRLRLLSAAEIDARLAGREDRSGDTFLHEPFGSPGR